MEVSKTVTKITDGFAVEMRPLAVSLAAQAEPSGFKGLIFSLSESHLPDSGRGRRDPDVLHCCRR